MQRKPFPFVVLFVLAGWPLGALPANDPDVSALLADGAGQAQARCYRLVHDDTYEFGDCVRELAGRQAKNPPLRLGIEYFGWVGAMNSAAEFLARFRASQAALGIDDRTLCASVPGDCAARIARIRQAERKPGN